MSLSTYLFYDGVCAEAFDFYKGVLGGDITISTTFGDAPPDMGVADADKGKIMHITMKVGDDILMGSDMVASFGEVKPAGGNFSLSYSPGSREDADRIFASLFDGGEISMEMQDTFWGSYFGSGRDRFGINWMINVDEQG